MVKILDENELSLFLKVLAEESVKRAYESELEDSRLFEQGEDEDPLFGGGDEGGDEAGGDEGGGDEDPLAALAGDAEGGDEEGAPAEEPAPEPAPEEPKQDKVEVRPTPLTLELGEVTSDGLMATLNMIRAGRSFKEPDVAAQMKKYFEEQLNDSEKLALGTFLSAIRDLTSGTPAKEAPEPGDENINIDATDQERAEHQPAPERIPSQPALQQQQTRTMPRGSEDTSPPIQVGPRNARLAEEYREHIKSLLVD